ncbi:Alternative oxidase, mitochondrial precursor [Perkinsus chesapeaki]|uniref:Alternative oxidase, mitochondrial n=1 Tax=Perkinsus chesapeaki TaxID=330153 RepID=A0A7J6N2R7_PERCH|nr:Alternative oxidase, mitochondrial precursor [Perkinsus chesapeaki]
MKPAAHHTRERRTKKLLRDYEDQAVRGLRFTVNGEPVHVEDVDPECTLLEWLRASGRCGTRLACGEGGCGACTVSVYTTDIVTGKPVHRSINSCLVSVCDVAGCEVTTIEGVKGESCEGKCADGGPCSGDGDCKSKKHGPANTPLHPIQRSLAEAHGSQCGYCTPGMVMSVYAKWEDGKREIRDIEEALDGNLCRCTGYRPIIQGMYNLVENAEDGEEEGTDASVHLSDNSLTTAETPSMKSSANKLTEAKFLPGNLDRPLFLHGKHVGLPCDYYRPTSLHELLTIITYVGNYRLAGGHSERRIDKFFRDDHAYPMALISTARVKGEMNSVRLDQDSGYATIGSAVSLTTLKELIEESDHCGSDVLRGITAMLRFFASEHIRNVATIGGNIATASPISDLNVVWLAAGASCRIARLESGEIEYREVAIDDFFISYRKVDLQDKEVLVSVTVPLRYDSFRVFKHSRRRQDDLSIVNAAIAVYMTEDGRVTDARVALGGMAPTTIRAFRTEKALVGHRIGCVETTQRIMDTIKAEFVLAPETPGGMTKYRMALARAVMYKFCMGLPAGATEYNFVPTHKKGIQYYMPLGDPLDPVGKPVKHLAADKQVRGCADYFDDTPYSRHELYIDFVLSTQSTGSVVAMDFSRCRDVEGFVGEVTHKDCTGVHTIGAIAHDEPVFAVADAGFNVSHCGQIIAIVAATSRYAARVSARAVKVTYSQERPPPIVSIEDAIREKSFHELLFVGGGDSACIHKVIDLDMGANIEEVIEHCLSRPDEFAVVKGRFKMAGQEHFYFETNGARAVPADGGTEVEVFSSTQHPHETQMHIAEVLGIPLNRVVVRTKRIGGGFGGKESRSCILASYAALAAVKFNRPARFQMDRDVDMANSGKRHAFLADYTVAVRRSDRKLVAADANAGYSHDLSEPVLNRAMMHMTNASFVRNVRVTGRLAKTNIESNTAFRGFGGPQGQAVAEAMFEHAACELGIRREELEAANWACGPQGAANLTHYNHHLGDEARLKDDPIPQVFHTIAFQVPSEDMWIKLMKESEFDKRRVEIVEYNKKNSYLKRGIAAVPIRYGISFTATHLNQATALITLQKDGSVQVCHVGVEMGQGLNTKVSQVVASELGIPVDAIHISEANTSRAPNGVPTAASSGTDLNANAAVDACRQLKETIKAYEDSSISDPQARLASAATKAFDRKCLSAVGFYRTPEIAGADWSKKEVNTFNSVPFYYYTYGAAASEVEVDVLTGETRVLRVDIVHDVGKSINPAIDIGQIEGAFMQGYGLFCMEELVYDKQGRLITKGPGLYKIPSLDDIPCDFRVALYDRTSGPTIRASKAVGEPPLFGGASVYYAIKEAIYAARGNRKHFQLVCPATPERIRLAISVPEAGDESSPDGRPVEDSWHSFA